MTSPSDEVLTGSRRVAWFHCFSGIAGDMALGSLLDAGADEAVVRELLGRLPITGWDLQVSRTLRGGISCTRAVVRSSDDGTSRTHADIAALVERAGLPDRVAERAHRVFQALAVAESALHGVSPDQVHFHEVGGHDAVVDVVGTAAALEALGVDRVAASAVATGTGTVSAAHGVLPNPAPAVVRLLAGAPVRGLPIDRELTTPTGAAILAALATTFGPMPAMAIGSSGFGAGRADPDDLPNVTQVVVGDAIGSPPGTEGSAGATGQPVLELQTNLDDVTGEDLAHALDAALGAGALDAWAVPVVMKKGRPGHVVHVLAEPADGPGLRDLLRETTGSFGVRAFPAERWPLARHTDVVHVAGGEVRMKVGPDRAKAEYEDLARIARHTGLPLRELRSRAEEAWRHQAHDDGEEP